MGTVRKTWGLRHLALRVKNVEVSQRFYETWFAMEVVWHPDSDNVYLSTGQDNLALHQYPDEDRDQVSPSPLKPLDHFGFLMPSHEGVEAFYQQVLAQGVPIVKPVRQHRDGSVSFYMADPDQNIIQILYEPHLQPLT